MTKFEKIKLILCWNRETSTILRSKTKEAFELSDLIGQNI